MTKRHFGSVRKLPSGRWQARYRQGSGGQVAAPTTFATKGDANRFLATAEADLARGQYLDPRAARLTLSEWASEWLCRPGKKPASVARDRQALDVFMPMLGGLPLSAITPSHLQAAVDARASSAAASTVIRDVAPLRALLSAAVDADLLARSPARRIALPKARPPERQALAPEALAALVRETPSNYKALVLTAGVLGLRWGESVGLRVRDIDFVRNTVTVSQVIEELAGTLRIVPEPKSRAALRTVTAPGFLLDVLAWHLQEHRAGSTGDADALVFVGPRGGVLRRRFGERVLRPAATRAGLDGLTFHALRHAAVSALVDEGVHPRVMAARAGHGTARLTLELYAHVSDSADREAAAALQQRFGSLFQTEDGRFGGGSGAPDGRGSG